MSASLPREAVSRALLLLFGTAVGVVLVEGSLQLAASFVSRTHSPSLSALSRSEDGLRILCLGDSNTYGFYVDREDSYPRVLERLLTMGEGRKHPRVVNFGYPGCNSSRLRNDFTRLLNVFHPDLVIVLIGANDFWSVPDPVGDAGSDGDWRSVLWTSSRVYRLVRLILRTIEARRFAADAMDFELQIEEGPVDLRRPRAGGIGYAGTEVFDLSWQFGSNPEWATRLAENLQAIARQARQSEIPLVFLTYASGGFFYGIANPVIREAAALTETPLIDVAARIRPLCPKSDCTELFFADHHPTAQGYHLVAETVRDALLSDSSAVALSRGEAIGTPPTKEQP